MVALGFVQSDGFGLVADDILEHLGMHVWNENRHGGVNAMNKQEKMHEMTLENIVTSVCTFQRTYKVRTKSVGFLPPIQPHEELQVT